MLRLLYQLGVILQHILKIFYLIMFHYNDSQLFLNIDYQLVKKELAFMITKTLFIRCYTNKCDLSLDSLQHNIRHYIFALTYNHFPKVTLNEQTNIAVHS